MSEEELVAAPEEEVVAEAPAEEAEEQLLNVTVIQAWITDQV